MLREQTFKYSTLSRLGNLSFAEKLGEVTANIETDKSSARKKFVRSWIIFILVRDIILYIMVIRITKGRYCVLTRHHVLFL